nr:hypothetical protein CACDSRKY_CACDSRKY_CDS_0015 [Caudoviricetes sp.]
MSLTKVFLIFLNPKELLFLLSNLVRPQIAH